MKEKEYVKPLGKSGKDRLRIRFSSERGKIVDLVVQYETLHANEWRPVVRYDCTHGFFHRDVMFFRSEKEKESVTIENLNDAFSYAEQDIRDHWQLYKSRFFGRRKK
jgi:hypothetical protein